MACTVVLPTVAFDDTCQTIKRGQVFKIYVTRPTTVDQLTDVTSLVEWTGRIDQDDVVTAANVACKIREMSGIGSWAEGEVTEVDIPLDQVYSVAGNKVLTFKIYDLTTANYAALIAWRANGTTQVKIWTEQDDTLFGGDAGINGSLRADIVVPEGRTEFQYGQITFTTKNSLNEVTVSPFPGIGN